MRFYLGVDHPTWLWREELIDVPLFISHRALRGRVTPFPRARTDWALDSGGFTELSLHGKWVTGTEEYVDAIRRYQSELGRLQWASPQDWMCEPWMTEKTGLSVAAHQDLTIENFLELTDLAPELPIIPVLQGWEIADYHRHVEAYASAGVDLAAHQTVGIGSVCRRQATSQIAVIFETLEARGLSMHGFGVKSAGLTSYAHHLSSADSLAWSFWARQDAHKRKAAGRPVPPCGKNTCSHCPHYALNWRSKVLSALDGDRQLALPLFA